MSKKQRKKEKIKQMSAASAFRGGERESVGASDEPHFLFPKYKDQSCALT